jgi:hypothetical protein
VFEVGGGADQGEVGESLREVPELVAGETNLLGVEAEMVGVGDARAVLVEQVDRVDQLAVDVELQLLGGSVTDSHRPRVGVAT